MIGKANGTVAQYFSALQAQELLGWFGVTGSVSQRAEVFLKAIGINPHDRWGAMDLGSVDYLTSGRREWISESRDRWLT